MSDYTLHHIALRTYPSPCSFPMMSVRRHFFADTSGTGAATLLAAPPAIAIAVAPPPVADRTRPLITLLAAAATDCAADDADEASAATRCDTMPVSESVRVGVVIAFADALLPASPAADAPGVDDALVSTTTGSLAITDAAAAAAGGDDDDASVVVDVGDVTADVVAAVGDASSSSIGTARMLDLQHTR
jgi:hypothetical protein